eukprot:TRINITY_DN14919_c0_g1_i2.p1 TRINITY_DN14919_c0_g1~~TRINITY_DN14919_c0_g1_i2.p1  ORF type:complete len:1330 (+),score=470.15 TRINITY_DN14919_c0_g1_i2:118-4107(+)
MAIGVDAASGEFGQCDDLFLPNPPNFEEAVAQGIPNPCPYKMGPNEWFLPPGANVENATHLTATIIAKRSRQISATHPAIAAHTLVTPLSLEASNVMQAASLPSSDPYGDAADEYVKKYRPYETLLNSQLLSIAPYIGVCYKAVSTPAGGCYTPGNVVTWCSPASASLLPHVASRGLLRDDEDNSLSGTFLVIQSLQGREVHHCSAVQSEREVLFPANTQFRTSTKISSAMKSLLQHELKCPMRDVDVITLCEVRLVVWRDVLSAMDEVEMSTCPQLAELIEQASQSAEGSGRYARDVVTGSYILGAPMTELPPRAHGGATVVHLVSHSSDLVGLLRMVTHHLNIADINELNADGRSPLHLALAHNNIVGAVHLLRNGAAIASLASEADLALAAAISHTWKAGTDQAIVERIVGEVPQSDLESVLTSKQVLRAAAGLGRMSDAQPLLQFLCKKAKNQNLKYLDTTGMIAAACASPNVDEAFITYLITEAQAKDSGAAVREAVESGNLFLLEHMKALGLSLDGVVNEGRTAMHLAAAKGDIDGLVALKEAGADAKVSDSFGWTLAHEAAYNNHLHLLELLKKWGAGLDERDVDGCTPLWWAADSGHDAVIRMLHKNGADPKVADSTDGTALLIAAYNGRASTVRLLYSMGADINKPDNTGRTPTWLAAGSGSLPVLQVLQELGAKLSTPDKDGLTPAHVAAQEGWADSLQFLNGHKVSLDKTDRHGRAPLHYAVAKSRFKCISYLVKAGANIAVASDDPNLGSGCMPVHVASTKLSFDSHPEEFGLLISEKTVNAVCKTGAPLDIAHSYNRHCSANKLRECGAESHEAFIPPEKMEEIPEVDVDEVVFRHPHSLPEKNAPGAVIRVMKNQDRFTYTLNGEERPSFKIIQLYKGSHGLALKFPDAGKTGRQVYLPVTGVREILGGLLHIAESAGISTDIRTDFANLCKQGHVAPVRQGSVSVNGGPTGKVSNEPRFVSVAFLSDAVPYLCSRIKVVTQYEGGEEGQSRYQWYKANDGENWVPIRKTSSTPDETGQHYAYYTTADELGCQLKCVCTPMRIDGKQGPPVESKVTTVVWPPHLGIAVVNKLVETVAATRITCMIRGGAHTNVYLQLNEQRIKVKSADQHQQESLLSGVMDGNHKVRCRLPTDDACSFDLEGMNLPATVQLDSRVDRDFMVGLIRVWSACCSGEVSKKVLGVQFEAAWKHGVMKTDEEARADVIWNAMQDPNGTGMLHVSEKLPDSAAEEARQALLTLRQAFASGQIKRPPTKSAGRAPSVAPLHASIASASVSQSPDPRPPQPVGSPTFARTNSASISKSPFRSPRGATGSKSP